MHTTAMAFVGTLRSPGRLSQRTTSQKSQWMPEERRRDQLLPIKLRLIWVLSSGQIQALSSGDELQFLLALPGLQSDGPQLALRTDRNSILLWLVRSGLGTIGEFSMAATCVRTCGSELPEGGPEPVSQSVKYLGAKDPFERLGSQVLVIELPHVAA